MDNRIIELKKEAIDFFEGVLVERFKEVPEEILTMPDMELTKNFKVSTVDFLLRRKISEMVGKARASGVDVKLETIQVCNGICSRDYFYRRCLRNHFKLSWYFIPMESHDDLIADGFYHAIRRVRDEVLNMPLTDKTAPVILKALEFFANRHLGPMLQRIEQKNLNVNVDGTRAVTEAINPDQLMQKYEDLRAKLTAPKEVKELNEPE